MSPFRVSLAAASLSLLAAVPAFAIPGVEVTYWFTVFNASGSVASTEFVDKKVDVWGKGYDYDIEGEAGSEKAVLHEAGFMIDDLAISGTFTGTNFAVLNYYGSSIFTLNGGAFLIDFQRGGTSLEGYDLSYTVDPGVANAGYALQWTDGRGDSDVGELQMTAGTYSDPVAMGFGIPGPDADVPLPAAAPLFAAGLAMLGLLRRRRRG